MSNQFVYQLLKHLALALYPEDITFLNDSKKYTIKEFMETQNLKKNLLPGDLVLTQTPGPIHSTIRKVAHWRYDHLAIIIDDENMLHVAPPNIRRLASNVLLMKKRNPLVLRLNISDDEREKIIKALMKEIGDRYDYSRALGLSGRVFASKMFGLVKKEKHSILDQPKRNICSDLIAYTIMEVSPSFKAFVKKSFKKLDISNYESFSPDDFWKLAEIDETQVAKIHESPVSDSSEPQAPEFQMREWVASIANGLLLYKRVKNSIKKDEITSKMGKFFVIFKYMFIHDLIPYEKEALTKLLPVNIRFVEFVLVLLQIRQYYYDTVIGQPLEMIKKLFPSFFLISSKLIGHKELDLILGTLGTLRQAKIGEELKYKSTGLQLIDMMKSKGLGGSINSASKL